MALPTYTTTYDAIQAMQAAFDAYWVALPLRTVVTYDNVPLDPVANAQPIVSNDPAVTGEAVLVMQILHSTGNISALGTRRFRQFGFMVGALYVENGKGRIRSVGKLGDAVLKFFQTVNVAGITFSSPRLNEVGQDGRWWQVNIVADFQYDIVRS